MPQDWHISSDRDHSVDMSTPTRRFSHCLAALLTGSRYCLDTAFIRTRRFSHCLAALLTGLGYPSGRPRRYFAGGTIFITNEVGFSVGPNGPGTLFFTAGMLLR
jgi:hypothetical protein